MTCIFFLITSSFLFSLDGLNINLKVALHCTPGVLSKEKIAVYSITIFKSKLSSKLYYHWWFWCFWYYFPGHLFFIHSTILSIYISLSRKYKSCFDLTCSTRINMGQSTGAVSYTHLDVYKRQRHRSENLGGQKSRGQERHSEWLTLFTIWKR